MATDAEIEALLRRLRFTGPGDLSIHHAAVAAAKIPHMATSPGSDNDKLWTMMQAMGWGTLESEMVHPPPQQVVMKRFTLNDEGKDGLARLLETLQQEKAAAERSAKLQAAFDELRGTVPERIRELVLDAGGSQIDITKLLLAVVTATMQRSISEHNFKAHLEFLYENAKEILKL
ncbi:MAG TPA: hypothetical protein VN802_04215 [Stellaceae bacterium]|nr:hypothetical protein [Stellaceae bacterium]